MDFEQRSKILKLLKTLRSAAKQHDIELYVVGGAIRDMLLKQSLPNDEFDFVVNEKLQDFVTTIQKELPVSLEYFRDFFTARAKLQTEEYVYKHFDVSQFRQEQYPRIAAIPIIRQGDYESDLQRRDFTINTLYMSVKDLVSIMKDGQAFNSLQLQDRLRVMLRGHELAFEDIVNKRLRVLHEESFKDDPTRIFRLARYEVLYKLDVEKRTKKLIQQAVDDECVAQLESYRIISEFKKIMLIPDSYQIIKNLSSYNVLRALGIDFHLAVESFEQLLEAYPNDKLLVLFAAFKFHSPTHFNFFKLSKRRLAKIEEIKANLV